MSNFQEVTTDWQEREHEEQQTMLMPCVTREQAAAEAERILAQLGYRPEVTST